jgi:hybrid polyketide synthase/nonribosomal peptide synthetase ACE1
MPYINEPIAVVGSGCRFPGDATNPSKLWDLLQDPRDVQRKIDRFRADNFYNKDGHYHGASNVLSAYLLNEDPKLFDSQFFNIPLSEAESIDPQQRLLIETVYESLEAAGLSMESLSDSSTAVYVGVMCNDFEQIGKQVVFYKSFTWSSHKCSLWRPRECTYICFDWITSKYLVKPHLVLL